VTQHTTAFTSIDSIRERQIFNGIRGRYFHGDRMTTGDVMLDAETDIPIHQHPHEQLTYLLEGQMEFIVGEEKHLMEAGDIAIIPGGVLHGGRTITKCRVIDTFAPARDDYR
jgi:quercetin dioxygenase-like cupin family protein